MLRLSRAQVREVDRISIEEYGLPGIVLMENAARAVTETIRLRFPTQLQAIGILCGSGNNGGDGYAVARHLSNRSLHVEIFDDGPPDAGDAFVNRAVTKQMGIAFSSLLDVEGAAERFSLWIDALFGTGLTRPLRDISARAVDALNTSGRPIVAVDLPSGLDCDTGEPLGDACIRADLTVTFVAEKLGFANPQSRAYTGEIVVGEIGCPRDIIDQVRTKNGSE